MVSFIAHFNSFVLHSDIDRWWVKTSVVSFQRNTHPKFLHITPCIDPIHFTLYKYIIWTDYCSRSCSCCCWCWCCCLNEHLNVLIYVLVIRSFLWERQDFYYEVHEKKTGNVYRCVSSNLLRDFFFKQKTFYVTNFTSSYIYMSKLICII